MQYLQVCTDETCAETEIVVAHLLPPEAATYTELIMSGGFDPDLAQAGFLGVMTLWVAGLTIGLLIGQLRKLKG